MQGFIFNSPQRATDRDRRREAIIQQIMGQGAPAPATATQGAMQGLGSLMAGFALRNHDLGPFPQAPAGGQISPFQGLINFFGGPRGGLY